MKTKKEKKAEIKYLISAEEERQKCFARGKITGTFHDGETITIYYTVTLKKGSWKIIE